MVRRRRIRRGGLRGRLGRDVEVLLECCLDVLLFDVDSVHATYLGTWNLVVV